jgi:hypothetical protein
MSRISSRSRSISSGRATHSLVYQLLVPEPANCVQRNGMLSSSSPAWLSTWLSTSAMRSMVPAATGWDSTGSTTQRIPTPALMSP